jgi:hypothetical protein
MSDSRAAQFRARYPNLVRAGELECEALGKSRLEADPKQYRRFRALCQTFGFKPPADVKPDEQETWWWRVYGMPEEFHDKLWDAILKIPRIWIEGFAKLASQWAGKKNALIARLAEELKEREDRIKVLTRRVRPRRHPTDLEDKIATFYENANLTQTEAAKAIGRGMKKKISQSAVSRALKAVNLWRGANPTLGLPQIGTKKGASKVATSVDPDVIDQGARTDGLTKRQRPRRKDDDSDE